MVVSSEAVSREGVKAQASLWGLWSQLALQCSLIGGLPTEASGRRPPLHHRETEQSRSGHQNPRSEGCGEDTPASDKKPLRPVGLADDQTLVFRQWVQGELARVASSVV